MSKRINHFNHLPYKFILGSDEFEYDVVFYASPQVSRQQAMTAIIYSKYTSNQTDNYADDYLEFWNFKEDSLLRKGLKKHHFKQYYKN